MTEITIKPLEWRFWDLKHEYGRGSWDANTPWETYSIHDVSERYPTDNRYYCPKVSDQFETLELAQAAAQRDHESRVRSAIDFDATKSAIKAKDVEIANLRRERDLLRQAVRRYGDKSRMGFVEPSELQQAIDAALNGGSDAP